MLGFLAIANVSLAQNAQTTLPGFTAYAVPEENGVDISGRQGVVKWTDSTNTVNFYFHTSHPGALKMAILAKSDAPSKIKVSFNGVEKIISVTNGTDYTSIPVLQTKLKDTGFYTISLKVIGRAHV